MSKVTEWFASWRLVSWRTAVVVGVALYALIGFFVVPWIAEKLIVKTARERLGREVTVEKIHCNPFTLSLTIEGFSLPDRPGSTLLSFDELYANAQVSSLFRWAMTLEELRIEHPYAALRRFEDGGINLVELKEDFEARSETTAEAEGLPRALFHLIRVTGGIVEFEDRALAEPLLWRHEPLEVLLTDISTIPEQEGDQELTLGLPAGGTIRTAGEVVVEPFGLSGSVSVDEIQLANTWAAVEEKFEFDVTGGVFSTDLRYMVSLADDGLHLEVNDLDVRIADLQVRDRKTETEFLTAGSVGISGAKATWPEQRLEAESLIVEDASAFVWLEPDGTPSWETFVPKPTQEEIVEAYEYIEERVSFDASLARFEVRNASAVFEDRTFSEPERLEVSDATLTLTDVSSQPESVWGLEAGAAMGGEASASVQGTFVVAPLTLDAEVGLEGLELSQFQAYVAKFAPLDLRAGVLMTSGKAHMSPSKDAPDITFTGEIEVKGLDLNETVTDGKLLGWGDLKVGGIEAALQPTSLDVEQVDIYSAGLEIAVAENGTINLLEFFRALGESEAADATGEATEESGLPPAHITRLQLHDCYGRYTDATTVEPFERKIESVNGTVSGIATDTTAGAKLEIDAAVDSGGVARVAGEIDLFDYARLTDLAINTRDVLMAPLSPMSVKMIGFPIEQGRASLDLSYKITDQKLSSTNHVEINDLKLGEKVEGEGKVKLPIKLGVSLLKDSEGRITLDIPIEGDLSNPEFVMTSAIASAATEVVSEIAKSPFRLLGRLGGGSDDEDLEFVDFAAGSAVLEEHVTTNLGTLAKALEQRPELMLEIEGSIDPEADANGLREAALASELGGQDTTADLETMYTSRFSSAETEALRTQHTSGAAEPALDEVAYRRALQAQLVETQPIDESQIQALASARAEAIRSFLVDKAGVDSTRVTILPEPASAATGEGRVQCRLGLTSGS